MYYIVTPMKLAPLSSLTLLISNEVISQDFGEKVLKTNISEVTVFQNGAHVFEKDQPPFRLVSISVEKK